MVKNNKRYYENVIDDLNFAIMKYNRQNNPDKRYTQQDIDPSVSQPHIHNVATGKSMNKAVRKKIEAFIEEWG